MTIADRFKVTPFDIFREDCDEVISLINYFIDKGNHGSKKPQAPQADGFWDF